MLAKAACNLGEDKVWLEDFPSLIVDVLQEEKADVDVVDD